MLISVISPAKKLDFESPLEHTQDTQPKFLQESKALIKLLKNLSSDEIGKLMKLSDKLSELNYERYQSFKTPFTPKNARPAIYAFKGDTYVGLDVESFSKANLKYASGQLRILSGLYGILSPFDLIRPYRLEMGTRFSINPETKNLYEYWRETLTNEIKNLIGTRKFLVNLASNEYFSVLNTKEFENRVITPGFKQRKNGELKSIGMMSKRARGMMAAYIIKQKLKDPAGLKDFCEGGYRYDKSLSSPNNPIFVKS